jgi:AbrB family looped-hinge helix DNA binding protein
MSETHLSMLTILTSKMTQTKHPSVEIRTATITEKGQISIPKEMRTKKFKEGQKVAIIAHEDRIEILPLAEFIERVSPALLSEKSLAKDWLSPEDMKAWKHL